MKTILLVPHDHPQSTQIKATEEEMGQLKGGLDSFRDGYDATTADDATRELLDEVTERAWQDGSAVIVLMHEEADMKIYTA